MFHSICTDLNLLLSRCCSCGLVVWFCWGVGSVVFVLLFYEILEIHNLVQDDLCTMHTWRLHSCKKSLTSTQPLAELAEEHSGVYATQAMQTNSGTQGHGPERAVAPRGSGACHEHSRGGVSCPRAALCRTLGL